MEKTGKSRTLIAHIERGSTFDGPGVRTVIFLKGCPLLCRWCHNPECISYEPETMYYPEKCIGCGRCEDGCYSGARVICGKEIGIPGLVALAKRDAIFYGNNGGVTVSGGEPLSHPDFTFELVRALKDAGLNVGIESSLYRFDRDVLSSVDIIMADLKIYDDALHREYTGIGNSAIKENIKKADTLGIPMIIRTPVIAGVNDGEDEIPAISEFARSLKNAVKYELLPYHPMGISKAKAIGKEQERFSAPDGNRMNLLSRYSFERSERYE